MPTSLRLAAVSLLMASGRLHAQCGGEERWWVKMGADAAAVGLASQTPVATTLPDLVLLPRPALPSDEETRLAEEQEVRTIDAFLVKFKKESGKKGDQDYHLVIADETLLFSKGGAKSPVSPHSVIAEVPDPQCVSGRKQTVTGPSHFAAELAQVRTAFETQFPSPKGGWNETNGIPVRLTGVVFFDRPHGQVGRALHGLELHPLLRIRIGI